MLLDLLLNSRDDIIDLKTIPDLDGVYFENKAKNDDYDGVT